MERIFTIEDAKKALEKRLSYYTARVEAWEKVERVRKKDGGDFATLSKNFTNCKFITKYGTDEIDVYFYSPFEGHNWDWLTISGNAYGTEPADTADKIAERIAERIALYNGYIETTKQGLETIGEQLEAIAPELEALKKAIKEAEKTDCKFVMQGYIKEYLRIL